MTQECLAELIGVQWQTISYLEKGKYPYPVMRLARLSQALNVSPNYLLEGLPAPDHERMEQIKKALTRKRKPKAIKSPKGDATGGVKTGKSKN